MDMKLDPAGLARRTEVMGTGFVDQALQDVDAFNLPLQQWVTAHAWGSTWQRDGIDLRTRSLVTIAMLAALGRSHELRAYVRGAVNNGAGWVEIDPRSAAARRCVCRSTGCRGGFPGSPGRPPGNGHQPGRGTAGSLTVGPAGG